MLRRKITTSLENHPSGMLGFRLTVLDFPCGVEVKIVDLMKASPLQVEPDGASRSVWIIAHYYSFIGFRPCLAFACFCRGTLRVLLDKVAESLCVI
jgi:hypothetical protein